MPIQHNLGNSSTDRAVKMEQRLINFCVDIIKMTNQLPKTYVGQHLSRQILRSGSAPALLYGEARGAESRKDFRHKLSIVLKELRETSINLRIIHQADLLNDDHLNKLLRENNELISIYVTTVKKLKSM